MLRTIIIDDEQKGRRLLQQMLERFCANVEVVAMAESADEGKTAIQKFNPDLVFLDIEMPYENGFQMLENITQRNFDVVFITAHNEYALQAIKYQPLDYLLKPISRNELQTAVAKANRKLIIG